MLAIAAEDEPAAWERCEKANRAEQQSLKTVLEAWKEPRPKRDDDRAHGEAMSTSKPTAPMAYVYDGQQCLGHVCVGPKGYEAFDRHDRSLGLFPTGKQAANALAVKEDLK